jgi:hypothetical protein
MRKAKWQNPGLTIDEQWHRRARRGIIRYYDSSERMGRFFRPVFYDYDSQLICAAPFPINLIMRVWRWLDVMINGRLVGKLSEPERQAYEAGKRDAYKGTIE